MVNGYNPQDFSFFHRREKLVQHRIMINKIVLLIVLLLISPHVQSQKFSRRPAWSQEFACFSKKALTGWDVYKGPYPTTEHYYTDSIGNLFVKGGCLHIKATADKRGDKVCSTSRISTLGYQSFLYGKLEVKAKIPTGSGLCPAIWMLREDHGTIWPIGEIDILEYIECFKKEKFATTIHLTYRENGLKSEPHTFVHTLQKETKIEKYHIYGLEWTPDRLTFTLDRKPYYNLTKEEAEYWPFDVPYILILNLAYGGWGASCGMDDNILPKEMLVDWIRYYPLIEEDNHNIFK